MVRRWLRRARKLPCEAIVWAIAIGVCLYVIVGPLLVARYPLMTDLPQHAANASVLRHYFDADWHFREQFVIRPFAVPYMLFYVVAALFMWVLPTMAAVKAAVFVMLALLPAGLATLFWGMRKSPLLGLSGVLFCWGGLASWGFLNFVAALGLWAMVIGVALRAVDRPAREASVMVGVPLALLFFTHPFRFPMAVLALLVIVGLSYALKKRFRSLVPVVVGALLVGIVWWLLRPDELAVELPELSVKWERLSFEGTGEHPYSSLQNDADKAVFHRAAMMVVLLGVLIGAHRWLRPKKRDANRALVAQGVVLATALAALTLYLVLPMEMGAWWFIYPRESTAAAFIALALLPDLPRTPLPRIGAVVWLAAALVPLGLVAIESHRAFDDATEDYARITERVPHAPKLMYLVFDRSGAPSQLSPFLHLPAYVQAEKGGWSSFSFAWLGHSPLAFRDPNEPGANVPPRPPRRWEWTPHRFELFGSGAYYDWFLVRSRASPAGMFGADPSIRFVAREGTWWLYHRER